MKNWAGNLEYAATRVATPSSVEEIANLVREEGPVKALGTRHSFSEIADTDGLLVSLENLNGIELGEDSVRIGAGVRYGDLAPVLHREGRALRNLASLPHIGVAGATATGTHGSGVANPCLSSEVRAMELVLADGSVRRIERGDPDFDGAAVHLGALGIVADLELDTRPDFSIAQAVYRNLPFEEAIAGFEEFMGSAYSVSFFTRWDGPNVEQVWAKSLGEVPPGLAFGSAVREGQPVHPVADAEPSACTDTSGRPGPWHERLPHFRLEHTPSFGEELQSEYLIPREAAPQAMEALRAIGSRIAPLLLVSEIRTVAADTHWMSPAYGRDSAAIHFTWKPLPQVEAFLPELESVLSPFDPRPHWGKRFAMSVADAYPRIGDFRSLCRRLDPQGRFENAFLRRFL